MTSANWSELIERAEDFRPAGEEGHEVTWPPSLDLEGLAEREPQLPKFIIPDWLPCGYATLLAGHGGVGKSGIALNLAVCVAAGVEFFGMKPERRRVLYLSCEDRESVLHWRLTRICRQLNVDLASLRGWLEVLDLVGHDAVLWERDPRTGATAAPSFAHLADRVRGHESELVVVDGISDTFAGNENARTDVKRYVNSLVSVIPHETGAVLLVGHIAKPNASNSATTEGYSGSTGWHNSVRARWYLYPETSQGEEGGRPERTGDLLLELQKSNLGRTDQAMRFSWDEDAHLFVGRAVLEEGALERGIRDRSDRDGILAALRACAASTPAVDVPAANTGPRTAYHVLRVQAAFPDSLRADTPASKRRFRRLIEELRAMGHVVDDVIRRSDRHKTAVLRLSDASQRGHAGNA